MRTSNFLVLVSGILFIWGCQSERTDKAYQWVNFAHLNQLSEAVNMNQLPAKLVRIYAEYPDYRAVEAAGEGIACVDDVARAAVLHILNYRYTRQEPSRSEARLLLNFILALQAENGLFHNFIFSDLSINKTHENSQALATWWSWRAVWALSEGLEIYQQTDPEYAGKLMRSIQKVFPAIDSLLRSYPRLETLHGISVPTWLPYGCAADQAGVMLQALVSYYRVTGNPRVQEYIQKIAEGILHMQHGDAQNFPFGAFLSWQNMWHAYGNIQAYALLSAGDILEDSLLISEALREIDFFYRYLIEENYLCEFQVEKNETQIRMTRQQKFPQIAYGIRPMVWACLKAYDLTGKEDYARMAGQIAGWLVGRNIVSQALYDPNTGRCFDGINNHETINKNSGAESTIEALLTLTVLEQNPAAAEIFKKLYQEIDQAPK